MADTKLSNPKDLIGSNKLPLHLWPTTATAMGCMAFLEGALKYGRSNFRVVGVRASIYKDALDRHMNAWFEGEDIDPESGLPHLAKALACIAIIVDAQATGELTDDRMVKGGYHKLVKDLTPHVERLKTLHAEQKPKHYTIADSPTPSADWEALKMRALSQWVTYRPTDWQYNDYTHEDAEGDPNFWGADATGWREK